jgi:hypothetical protein
MLNHPSKINSNFPFQASKVDAAESVTFEQQNTSSVSDEHTSSVDSDDTLVELPDRDTDAGKMLQTFLDLMQDEKGRKLFTRMLRQAKIENVRPIYWSKRARAPYYRRRFAEEIKSVIDRLLDDKRDKIFLYASFPTLSKNSLYLKIHQAFLFLVEEMDDEKMTYRNAKDNIAITKESTGILLTWVPNSPALTTAEDAKDNLIRNEWKNQLDKFLEQAEQGEKLSLTGLHLTQDDLDTLDISLCQLKNFAYKLSPREIHVLRLKDVQNV